MTLPHWRQGTPAVLCVAGPHAIPVSTAVRLGDHRLAFALGQRREALERLRADPRVALCLLGTELAFTAHGTAAVVREALEAAPVVGVELSVEQVQDHLADGRTEMLDGARWRWLDPKAAGADPKIVAELATHTAVLRLRLECPLGAGEWFDWALLDAEGIACAGTDAGLEVVDRWSAGAREFAELAVP